MPAGPIEQLIAAVEAGPPDCWAALRSLGDLAQPEANAFLAALFAHEDPVVRRSAVIALGANHANTAAAVLLTPLLADEDRFVRHHAGVAFHRLRGRPWTTAELDALVQTALDSHRDGGDHESEDLVALVTLHDLGRGVPAVDPAAADHVVDVGLAMLRSDDPVARVFAIRLLRESHREAETASAFLDALRRERDPGVASWCIGGLGFRGTSAAVETLATFVAHPDVQLRYRVATALSSCALPTMSDAARDALLALADDTNADVRYSALYELSSWWQNEGLRDALVRQRLTRGLTDDDEGVRSTCAEALERDGAGG